MCWCLKLIEDFYVVDEVVYGGEDICLFGGVVGYYGLSLRGKKISVKKVVLFDGEERKGIGFFCGSGFFYIYLKFIIRIY